MIKKLLSTQLRINMASGVVMTMGNAVIHLLSYPIYLHFLGYEKYGVWLVLATVLTFFQLGGNFGIETAVRKLVAEELGNNNAQGIRSYVAMASAILTLSGCLGLILILYFQAGIISLFNLTGENGMAAFVLLPYIGLLCIYLFITRVFSAALGGLGRMDLANFAFLSGQIAFFAISVSLLYRGWGIESFLVAHVVSCAINHLLCFIAIRRLVKLRLLRLINWDWFRCKKLLHFSSGIVSSSLLQILLVPFNKVMLSRYAGPASIVVYEIAWRGSVLIRSLVESGFRAFVPEISRIGAGLTQAALEKIVRLNRRALRIIAMWCIPLFGGFMIGADVLFRLLLRKDFVDELPFVFRIMLVGTFLSLLCVPAFYTLIGLGRIRHTVISHGIISFTNVVIVMIILMTGAKLSVSSIAWAMLVGMGIASFYVIWQNRRLMTRTQPPLKKKRLEFPSRPSALVEVANV